MWTPVAYSTIATYMGALFVNVCLYIECFTNLYNEKFHQIDKIIKSGKLKNHRQLQILLKDIVELHIEIVG